MHLIKKMCCIFKGNSNSKHFSFFVLYFNVLNKISSNPPQLLNFQKFSKPPFIPTPCLLSFKEFSNPSHLFQLLLLLGTQEYITLQQLCLYIKSVLFGVTLIRLPTNWLFLFAIRFFAVYAQIH